MKKLALIVTFVSLLFVSFNTYASRQNPSLGGRVLDENNAPVEYATVVLLINGTDQVTGATTDTEGRFRISAKAGRYTMRIFYLGYEDVVMEVELPATKDIDDVKLMPISTQVEAVQVTGKQIVREADRFVVTVANNPLAIGKDAFEMLKTSPGVWINGTNITINGRSGTRVMVNDRMLRQTGEELEEYLRSIKAEDILKIEIIPQSGADYDADASGGIIKITLAKQRNDGVQGNISLNGVTGRYIDYQIAPSAGLSYQSGKLNLYANGGYAKSSNNMSVKEVTTYSGDSPGTYNSHAKMSGESTRWNGSVGGVYDFNPKNSLGAEFSIYSGDNSLTTDGTSVLNRDNVRTDIVSDYLSERDSKYYTGTVNYIHKLDDKGSTFKLIGDYAGSKGTNDNLNKDVMTTSLTSESYLRDISDTDFAIYSANAAFELVKSPTTVIRTGVKYAYNSINSKINISNSNDGSAWTENTELSSITDYAENIGALYLVYNTRLGKFGITAGLRGEYTYIVPKYTKEGESEGKEKGYFDLFPNLNVSLPLKPDYSNMLVLSYSRNISRPHFSYLSPFRNQTSTYSYIAGNPDLKPTYTNNISLTAVFAYKYNVTIGASILKNQIMQKVINAEEEGENVLIYRFENIPTTANYFISINAPITIKEWWTANINVTGLYMTQNLREDLTGVTGYTPPKRRFTVVANASTNISIPKWFDIELSGNYMSKVMNSNMIVEPMANLNASIKKRFAKNKITASLGVSSIFYVEQEVNSYGPGFDKWTYVNNGDHLMFNLSLRYNFTAGQSFKARKVERGAEEDIKRLGGGNGGNK